MSIEQEICGASPVAAPRRCLTGWQQNGPTEQGMCLIEVGNRISIELTGSQVNGISDAEVQQTAELVIAAPAMAKLLAKLEPHLDAIICFASTMDEYEPNAIAADVRGWLGHLRDVGALPAQVQP
jgi:hypothetical protein